MKKNQIKNLSKQFGMTLLEIIAALAIIAAVVVGALALFGNANSANSATQLLKDVVSIRSAGQALFMGQGGYGTASFNAALITGNKIPATMTTATPVINTSLGGTLTVTGDTNAFKIALTNVPADVCTSLVTNASTGWKSVAIGSTTITSFPVSPGDATASGACGGTAPFTITWTTLN